MTSAKINSNSPIPNPIPSTFFDEINSTDEYHDYIYTARRYLEKVRWINEKNEKPILDLADRYIRFNRGRKIVLNRIDPPNGGDKLILPYTHRFHHSYISKINRKLDRIRKSRIRGVHIVLTTNPANFTDLSEACKNIKKAWNKLATYLRKKWGRICYLCVLELTHTTNYLPHLHVIVWGKHHWHRKNPLIPQKKLSDLWAKYGQGQVVFIRSFNVNIAGYLMKYIRKQQKIQIYGAILWALGLRTFSISQNLNEIINECNLKTGEYEFLFTTFDYNLPIGYARHDSETAIDIRFILRNIRDKSSVIIA